MATPKEILSRAGVRRQAPAVHQPVPVSHPVPAPAPMQMHSAQRQASVQPAVPAPQPTERIAVPQPIRTNSVYRQLMRSHDRMHTRHLGG